MRRSLILGACSLLALAACSDDGSRGLGPDDTPRVFNQIERLGNPLVSEVFLAKRNHGFHNAGMPATDATNHTAELEAFVRTVAGRSDAVANTLSGVLLPDMLIVQTTRPANSSGWLSWALADGYGGRNLTDDVVDAGLAAVFGALLDNANVTPQLTTDNVDANDQPFQSAFPYLAEPSVP